MENIKALRELRADSAGVADTGADAHLSVASILPDADPVSKKCWWKAGRL